ncbi:MAG: serine/threonine-protein kinase, partial [Myxococcota bacterium]
MHICIVCWHAAPSPLPRCPRCGELHARSKWPKLPWSLPGHKHLTLQAYHNAGGQGVVYRAIDSIQNKEVAVKLLARNLPPEEYEDEIDRFAREKAAMDFISHAASLPMFVDVYDFHRGSQEPELDRAPAFLEMEFIPWPTLGEVIRDKGKLPMNTVFRVALELTQALRIMSRRIIHNDIKPHNLFVNLKNNNVELKVTDFGIWVPDDDKVVTQVGAGPAIAGTIAYMSPEQSSGDRWDSRSDTYAACCVIWQCCTGSRPFPHITARLSITEQLRERRRVTQEFPSRPESIPPELYEVLRKGLRYEPRDRHENANEFRSHLQDAYRRWRMRMDDERKAYLAKLEGFAAAIATQRQKLSAYYLAYVELRGFSTDIEEVLSTYRDDPPTTKFDREDAKTRSLDDEATRRYEPEEDPLDLARIEAALDNSRKLLTFEGGDDVAGQEGPTVDLRAPTNDVKSGDAKTIDIKTIGAHASGAHASGPHAVGVHASGAHASGPHTIGVHASGAHASGPHTIGVHASGAHASGPHTIGVHAS